MSFKSGLQGSCVGEVAFPLNTGHSPEVLPGRNRPWCFKWRKKAGIFFTIKYSGSNSWNDDPNFYDRRVFSGWVETTRTWVISHVPIEHHPTMNGINGLLDGYYFR